jgi:hypothetical protein
MKKFRDFESAREFAISLNLKGHKEWQEYCKSGDKPADIPSAPHCTYKNEFKGSGDWLGTGTIAAQDKVYRSFEKAREFAISLNLKSQKEWNEYCKSGNKPGDIPQDVAKKYKNNGWEGFGYFLGTGRMATRSAVYLTFDECKKFVHNLHLSGQNEWVKYCKIGEKPLNIPVAPWRVYKNKGWKNMGEFFGTGTIANQNKPFRSYKEAKKFARSLGLKNNIEWKEYCKSGNKPDYIPSSPEKTYKNKGWVGVGDWLGTGNVKPGDIQYRSPQEAKEFVKKLGLKNAKEWNAYCTSGNKPDDIPSAPWKVYKKWNKK